ncbi:prepilin-type N-terminal cleavage/methylation domain-containing protein [Iocasia frigidifontis]|uniref:Prepilin-type N-terminal cleavage/methylation domain-containing protein n=1 Tax=Iocasia fonsfrigidae TaxID=2682810 RepID=A0A8A7KCN6_9FIRM|nr:prepilin-type N-terminal cleavage/methylation domain-containing protein [Iocasia fonsfrigidae]QTL97159.1 prepilin-type N-terminal cleavage/methylation domain-containing protein [Iocasia fonsfrigidae]
MSNEKGFTLIEVLIAMVILGISFTILIEGYRTIMASAERNRDYLLAAKWSEDKLISIVNGDDSDRRGYFEENGKEYSWWVEEKCLDDNLIRFDLIMSWPGLRAEIKYSCSRYLVRSQ